MAVDQPYITDDVFSWLLDSLNMSSLNAKQKDDLLSRAVGDFEADMAQKFVVPLTDVKFQNYCAAPAFARAKALNAVKAKIRQLIGVDQNRNLVIESTEKYIDTHKIEYQDNIKTLLNPLIEFGFAVLDQAQDAQSPVQHIALSRADNYPDWDWSYGRGHKTEGFF